MQCVVLTPRVLRCQVETLCALPEEIASRHLKIHPQVYQPMRETCVLFGPDVT